MNRKQSVRAGVLVVAACGLALSWASPAQAQQERRVMMTRSLAGGGGPSGMISTRALERWEKVLGLGEEQAQALKALHEGYQAAYQSAAREMNDVMEEARRSFEETQDPAAFGEKMPAARKAFGEKTRAAEASFLADAKTLLSPEQEQAWPKIERMRRREQAGRLSTISGDAVDLSEIVEGLKVPADPALAQALEEYESESDKAIQSRLKAVEAQSDFEPGRPIEMEAIQKQMDESREAGLRLKDINQRHARKVEPLLPEEKREEFRRAVKKQSFPQVYRTPLASRWLDASGKMADLDTQQRSDLDGLREQYERELAQVNDAWASAIEKSEAKSGEGGTIAGGGGTMIMRFGDDDPELSAARKARRELDEKTREKIKGILRPEQREALPKPEEEGMIGPGGSRVFIR